MSESDNIGPTESPFQIFNAESFGHALRHYRRSAGLTQAEFAEMAGLRQSQISELESGKMTAQTRRLVTPTQAPRSEDHPAERDLVARVTELAVWMDGYQVGTLTRHRGTLAFAYAERALRHYPLGAPLVSVALLNRKEEHRGQVVKLFFEGLLPEGEARVQLASGFAVDPADTFALLAALGRDCAGALVIVPRRTARLRRPPRADHEC